MGVFRPDARGTYRARGGPEGALCTVACAPAAITVAQKNTDNPRHFVVGVSGAPFTAGVYEGLPTLPTAATPSAETDGAIRFTIRATGEPFAP